MTIKKKWHYGSTTLRFAVLGPLWFVIKIGEAATQLGEFLQRSLPAAYTEYNCDEDGK